MIRDMVLVVASLLLFTSSSAPVTVYLVGDSTMADKPDAEHNPERGWGQALPTFAAPGVAIKNHAVNGRSTRSFIAEGRWEAVRSQLHRGDFVFIQFGHNDQKNEDSTRYTAPFTAYRRNLERFVLETRAAGARPVLFTSIVRRQWNAQGVLEDTHGLYSLAVRHVARALSAPLVDLQLLTEDMVLGAGVEGSKQLYVWTRDGEFPAFPLARSDNTHLSANGAREVAALAVEALVRLDPAFAKVFAPAVLPAAAKERRDASTNVLNEADIRDQAVGRVEELFLGRFSGVQVFSAPGGITVRIRGAGTPNGGGEPLYVIDGMTMETNDSGLIAINPRDVIRIEVLKDVGSTAEYGVRGANGVIRITTRRPL